MRGGDDRVIAGVASGAAHYLQVDPLVVRIAFVVLCLLEGVGFLLYMAGGFSCPTPP
ncbi:MAG: PspC domain-containing protein [Actinomycetota bacterium]|nr:PspC domain-containing protein [Actinomycetota bacterium]